MKRFTRPLYQKAFSIFIASAVLVSSLPSFAQRNESDKKDRGGKEQVRRTTEPQRSQTPQRPTNQQPTRRTEPSIPQQNRPVTNRPTTPKSNHSWDRPTQNRPSTVRQPTYRQQEPQRRIYTPSRPEYRPHYRPIAYKPYVYHYHPYSPYYEWGYRWHPAGSFLDLLATTAIIVGFSTAISELSHQARIYYDDGVFYQSGSRGYEVIVPPLGAIVLSIPQDSYEFTADGIPYFYFAGVFYTLTYDGYQVVEAPLGAIVSKLPPGATEQRINGRIYYFIYDTYYQPIYTEVGPAFQVVNL